MVPSRSLSPSRKALTAGSRRARLHDASASGAGASGEAGLARTSVEPRQSLSGLLGGFGRGILVLRGLGDERRVEALHDRLPRHDALLHVAPRGQLELHVEERLLEDRPQAARAGLAFERLVGDRAQRLVREHEIDPVELEEAGGQVWGGGFWAGG